MSGERESSQNTITERTFELREYILFFLDRFVLLFRCLRDVFAAFNLVFCCFCCFNYVFCSNLRRTGRGMTLTKLCIERLDCDFRFTVGSRRRTRNEIKMQITQFKCISYTIIEIECATISLEFDFFRVRFLLLRFVVLEAFARTTEE